MDLSLHKTHIYFTGIDFISLFGKTKKPNYENLKNQYA